MTHDRKHDPIPLPPGSFELDELHQVSAAAAKASDDHRDATVAKLLDQANQRVDQDSGDFPGRLPGHRIEKVERVHAEGVEVPTGKGKETEVVGRVAETRTIQVFDPKAADEEIAALESSGVAAAPVTAGATTD
jgi:hypothetical protein